LERQGLSFSSSVGGDLRLERSCFHDPTFKMVQSEIGRDEIISREKAHDDK